MDYLETLTHPFDQKRIDAAKKKKASLAAMRYSKARKAVDTEYHRRMIFNNRSWQTRQKGIEFTVLFEEVPYTGVCPVTGDVFTYQQEQRTTPSLDRIDLALGYVKGNVRWITHQANRWKNDMRYEDVKKLLDNFYKL